MTTKCRVFCTNIKTHRRYWNFSINEMGELKHWFGWAYKKHAPYYTLSRIVEKIKEFDKVQDLIVEMEDGTKILADLLV